MKSVKRYLSIFTIALGLSLSGYRAQAIEPVIFYSFDVQFFAKKTTEICPQVPQEAPADLCASEIKSCRDFAREKLFKYFTFLEDYCELTNPHGGEWKCTQKGFDDLNHFVGVLKEGNFDEHHSAKECVERAAAEVPKDDATTDAQGNAVSDGTGSGTTGVTPTQAGGSSVAGSGFMVQAGSGCSLATQASASSLSSYWTIWVSLNLIHFYRRTRQNQRK